MFIKKVNINTTQKVEFKDITSSVRQTVRDSGVENGLCVVYIPHTTAGVTINENADPDVVKDMTKTLNEVIPFDNSYAHMEGNSAAHIKASLMGSSVTVIVEKGELLLGTWQGIYFCEFDGSRNRKFIISVN